MIRQLFVRLGLKKILFLTIGLLVTAGTGLGIVLAVQQGHLKTAADQVHVNQIGQLVSPTDTLPDLSPTSSVPETTSLSSAPNPTVSPIITSPLSTHSASPTSKLPPCQSETATGCDRSNLQKIAGTNASAACEGHGPAKITASPIAFDDLNYIQPMGLMIGGHVTPIDHGYFYIKGAVAHPPVQAPVYAPLDGIITRATRTIRQGDPAAKADAPSRATYDDDSVSIEATCTFRVRFSNMVRFAGPLGDQLGTLGDNETKTPNYHVKAGELIGYTGLPTAYGIDVWVENDETTLTGFINPAEYIAAESWKVHMVDLFDYTVEPLKSQLLGFLERDATPRWGKIDYDQDGKLIGTWFKVGTGGYGGNQFGKMGNYWAGHLSIVPDGNDPTQIDVSFGDWQGQAQQFAVVGNKPDPATVDQESGLIRYELGQIQYYSADTGAQWTAQTYVSHIRTKAGPIQGTVLLKLTGQRQLKMEIFPGKTSDQVSDFDDNALMYER